MVWYMKIVSISHSMERTFLLWINNLKRKAEWKKDIIIPFIAELEREWVIIKNHWVSVEGNKVDEYCRRNSFFPLKSSMFSQQCPYLTHCSFILQDDTLRLFFYIWMHGRCTPLLPSCLRLNWLLNIHHSVNFFFWNLLHLFT